MQSRQIRAKNFGLLMLFMGWNVVAVSFIAYRLRSDDLDLMEKEAEERIRIAKSIKEQNKK